MGTHDWFVAVEYRGAPVMPGRKAHFEMDPRVKLASMTIDGTSRTRISASVQAESEKEAREVGLAGLDSYARLLKLPDDPFKVDVRS